MRYRLVILLALGLCCLGMGKKQLPLAIRFYTETGQGDTESFAAPVTLLNGQGAYVDQIANISERDIVAVYPFVAADGSGGCAFKLDDHGTVSLDSLSVEKKGSLLIAMINSSQVADILINQRVTDGIITVPSGITTDQMKMILKRYPIIGGKKATKKKTKDVYSTGM
ncbi:MAG TPA: hypothetical protein VHY22_07990 [Chthoniobacteraceae bacterium]|jgi:hypothetical protein|nr:hypothetical protein [Chthoniobacteraceae bacterium]